MEQTVLIGISGGIAAVKSIEIIKTLKEKNINLEVIMTSGASALVNPKNIEKEIGKPVYKDLFDSSLNTETILKERRVEHIDLAGMANLIVVAPATANLIAKIANGIADDYLTTTILAATCPVVICPSMNVFMWTNPATQTNIKTLRERGYVILGPDKGMLACGYEGHGRLIDMQKLTEEILRLLSRTESLKGKKIIITAGGTREYIDDIRFIGNKSSGKMGIAIAEEAYLRGADIFLFRSSTSVHPKYHIKEKIFETSEDLELLLKKDVENCDMLFHAAAVSDFNVKNKQSGKIKSDKKLTLELIPSLKLLDWIKKTNSKIKLIAFKAEWNLSDKDLIDIARNRLQNSNADYIVANDVGRKNQGFDSDENEVFVIDSHGNVDHIKMGPKTMIAREILEIVCK